MCCVCYSIKHCSWSNESRISHDLVEWHSSELGVSLARHEILSLASMNCPCNCSTPQIMSLSEQRQFFFVSRYQYLWPWVGNRTRLLPTLIGIPNNLALQSLDYVWYNPQREICQIAMLEDSATLVGPNEPASSFRWHI